MLFVLTWDWNASQLANHNSWRNAASKVCLAVPRVSSSKHEILGSNPEYNSCYNLQKKLIVNLVPF